MKRHSHEILFILVLFFGCQKEATRISADNQLEKDLAEIDAYLSANNISAEKDSTQQLRYTISKTSTGRKPVLVDSVKIKHKYYVLSGSSLTFVDSTKSQSSFLLSSLIPGCRKIIPLMGEGAAFSIYVPSGLAYGSYTQGKVPANAKLVFNIELTKVIPEYSRQLKKDIASIDAYLTSNNIAAQTDNSGLRYIVLQPGTGAVTSSSDSVTISYTGRFFDQTIFDQTTQPKKYALNKTLKAWQIGLSLLQKGGSIQVFAPSGLAYGAYGANTPITVPPATNVIYTLTLVDIKKK